MNDALLVRRGQGIGDLHRQIQEPLRRKRPSADLVFERSSLEMLHNDERAAFVLADVVDRADVGMIQ